MKKLITIDMNQEKQVTLKQILNDVSDIGFNFNWAIFDLEAEGDLGDDGQMYAKIDNEKKIKKGYLLSWEDLNALSIKLDQIINVLLAASPDVGKLSSYTFDYKTIYSKFPLVVSMVDGYSWEIYTSDIHTINKLKNKYTNIKIEDAH